MNHKTRILDRGHRVLSSRAETYRNNQLFFIRQDLCRPSISVKRLFFLNTFITNFLSLFHICLCKYIL